MNYWSQTKKQGEINKDLEAYVWQLQRQARHSRDCLLKATAKQQASAASTGNRSWLRKCFKTGVKKTGKCQFPQNIWAWWLWHAFEMSWMSWNQLSLAIFSWNWSISEVRVISASAKGWTNGCSKVLISAITGDFHRQKPEIQWVELCSFSQCYPVLRPWH